MRRLCRRASVRSPSATPASDQQRRYFASGSFGQHIEVAPDKRTVVAIHSYWPAAFNGELIDHNDTFVDALITFAGSGPAR